MFGAARPLPLKGRLSSRELYLLGGVGFWLIKFSRVGLGDAFDLNPAFRLGLGADVRTHRQGVLRIEGAYLPLRGPSFVISSFTVALKYSR
jgi:hypothetical protein